ncbi:MAG: protein-disulfide reductase DsbD family protein [Verrucomicrobiota bacterium]
MESDSAQPGDTVLAAIPLRMDAGWHTYWKNPGGSGMATSVKWELPPGITAGELRWPPPEVMSEEGLTTYVYKDEATLLVPLQLGPDLKSGPVEIKARVSWLECEVQCVPGSGAVSAALNVGTQKSPSKEAAAFAAWQKQLPQSSSALSAVAWWESPDSGDKRTLILQWNAATNDCQGDFFPYAQDDFEVQAATDQIPGQPGLLQIRKQVTKTKTAGTWPTEISGVLAQKCGAERSSYEVKLSIASQAPAMGAAAVPTSTPQAGVVTPSLWKMLLYAFIGGLILNIMPCVLPVIALKILGFVGQAENDVGRVRKLGLIYAAGVLVSFFVLAGLVIGVRATGHSAGWGMQFGNPQFLVALTALVTLVALNLFGLFEINVSGKVLGTAGALASRHGASGAFFNGVLATILATPCTAPFLGAALGFAFTQKPPLIVLMFTMVGIGLAFPYVVLSWHPAWLKFLPKPGAWMERFKIAMGFPMLMTAAWLFSLLPSHYGARSSWVLLFLVLVALAAWVYGEFVQRASSRRLLAGFIVAALLGGNYAYVLEGQLHWRAPEQNDTSSTAHKNNPNGIDWQPWSVEALAKARATGRPVLVDFTADWCLTCQVNKKIALEIPSVQAKLKELNAIALLGDYTKLPEAITAELNHYGRAGVPLVLVYPAKAASQPIVLPEALTPGIVLGALEQATR